MSDRMAGEIRIGGQVKRRNLARFLEAVNNAGGGLEWGEHNACFKDKEELLASLEDGVLVLRDDEARYGQFEELEADLIELGLAYDRQSEGKYEYDPELASFRPGMKTAHVRCTNEDGNEVVRWDSIAPIIQLLDKGKVGQAVKKLKRLHVDIPELPPLEIVD